MEEMQKISNLIEYISFVQEYYIRKPIKKHLFFSGVSSKKYSLLPSVFRSDSSKKSYNEKDIFLDFMQYAPANNITYDFVKDCDKVLADMQHYGMPTRLLDWTVNPLVALYFACQPSDNDGKVYLFNPWGYNGQVSDYKKLPMNHDINIYARSLLVYGWNDDREIEKRVNAKYMSSVSIVSDLNMDIPFAYVSPFSNNRKIYQRGCFLIYGKSRTPFETMQSAVPYMDCIIIDKSSKETILTQLNLLYINDYSVYPDYEGMRGMIKKCGSLFNV